MTDTDIQTRIVALETELCCVLTNGGETRGVRERLAVLHVAKARADEDAAAVQAEAKASPRNYRSISCSLGKTM